jgi:hypothetical protein
MKPTTKPTRKLLSGSQLERLHFRETAMAARHNWRAVCLVRPAWALDLEVKVLS